MDAAISRAEGRQQWIRQERVALCDHNAATPRMQLLDQVLTGELAGWRCQDEVSVTIALAATHADGRCRFMPHRHCRRRRRRRGCHIHFR